MDKPATSIRPPQMYRGPPRIYSRGGEKGEDEENRSETPTDSDDSLPEGPDVFRMHRRRANSARHHNSQGRRRRRQDLDDSPGSVLSPSPRSYAHGETVRFGTLHESYPRPQGLRHSPPPTKPYPTNPQSANVHSANHYPGFNVIHEPSFYANPANPYPTSYHPASNLPTNLEDPYHANLPNPYYADTYPVPPYSTNTSFMPSYGAIPHVPPEPAMDPPYSVESQVENLKRELSSLKMEQRAGQEREKDEYKRKRKEANRRNSEILKRQVEQQVRAEIEKRFPKRSMKTKETRSDTGRGPLDSMVKDAMEYMEDEQHREENFRLQGDRRHGEAERLLLQLLDFAEQRQAGYDWRTRSEGSTRSRVEGPSRSRVEEPGSRRELAPRGVGQNEDDASMRNQIEYIVLDVLQHLDERETQEKNWQPLLASQSVDYEMERNRVGETRQRCRERRDHDHGARRAEYMNHRDGMRQRSSPSDTQVSHSDQYSRSESYGSVDHSEYSAPQSRHRDRKHRPQTAHPVQSHQPPDGGRAYAHVLDLDNTRKQPSRNANDDGLSFVTNANTNTDTEKSWYTSNGTKFNKRRGNASMGRESTKRWSATEAERKRHYDTTTYTVDESEHLSSDEDGSDDKELYPTRSTQYTYVPRGKSRRHRQGVNETIPPEAPNPPLE